MSTKETLYKCIYLTMQHLKESLDHIEELGIAEDDEQNGYIMLPTGMADVLLAMGYHLQTTDQMEGFVEHVMKSESKRNKPTEGNPEHN